MKQIPLGVIGLGVRGKEMALIADNQAGHLFKVVAVCDAYPSKVEQAVKELGLPASSGYTDYHQFLQVPDMAAVLVETGAQVMSKICCDALNAGKHVIADVPMVFTRQDCWDLVVTVEKTGLVYAMGEQVRFSNFVMKWKEHIEHGDIGEPLFIQGEYIHPAPCFYFEKKSDGTPAVDNYDDLASAADNPDYLKTWRNSFEHVIKYIPHELSPLMKIVSDRITHVSCVTADTRMLGDGIEMLDLECALMQTSKGRAVRIVNSFTAPRCGKYEGHWYHIMGTDGVLETARLGWGGGFGSGGEIILHKDGTHEKTNYGWTRKDMPFGDSSRGHGGLELFSFNEFYNAIREDKESEINVYTAMEAILPGIIAAESSEAGGILVEVPDVRPNTRRKKGEYPVKQD